MLLTQKKTCLSPAHMKPVASMTGFASATQDLEGGTVGVELKTVNARFLDLNLRITDELRATEPLLRESVTAALARGKVECRVSWQSHQKGISGQINEPAVRSLAQMAHTLVTLMPNVAPLRAGEVLSWPGVLDTETTYTDETLGQAVKAALDRALSALKQSRAREGEALRSALLQKCDGIDKIVAQLHQSVPTMLAALEKKLNERLQQGLVGPLTGAGVMSAADINERIRQEVTLYGLRADVDEELNRLATHVQEVRRVLSAGGPVGRRLDFLMQELNREANTLGSKASAVELSQAAIELKLLIEQMREQIQNLE